MKTPFRHCLLATVVTAPMLFGATPEPGSQTFYPFPHFTWAAHSNAFRDTASPVHYDIQISCDAGFVTLYDQDRVALNRYIHDRPMAPGNYFWRVRAVPMGEQPGAWPSASSFTITPCDEEVRVEYLANAADHGAAVDAAMARARELGKSGKSVRLVLPAGTYHFDRPGKAFFDFDGMQRLVVEGEGATVHLLRVNSSFSRGRKTLDLAVMGFTVDYPQERTFLQGRVTRVDESTGQITVRLEPGFPGYEIDYVKAALKFFCLIDPKVDGRLKEDSYNAFFFEKDKVHNADGTWTMTLTRHELSRFFTIGDRFVHFLYGQETHNSFFSARNVTFYGMTHRASSSLHYTSIEGTLFNVLHCRWDMTPGRWFCGNGDGVHCRGLEFGPWIEACTIQGVSDDAIALYARPTSIAPGQTPSGNALRCRWNDHFNLEAGNEVSFFDPVNGKILLECEVRSVSREGQGDPWVTFSRELPGGLVTQGDLQRVSQIWNRSKSCGDFVVRDNTIRNIRRYGTVFRARRGVVENNRYEAASTSGILFKNEPSYPNGLYCSDIQILSNRIERCSFDRYHSPPLGLVFNKIGSDGEAADIGPRRVLIEGNRFLNCPSPEIGLYSAGEVVLRGNEALSNGVRQTLQVFKKNLRETKE